MSAGEAGRTTTVQLSTMNRQKSTLIMPNLDDFDIENQNKNEPLTNSLSLNQDIYNALLILMVYGLWDKLSMKEQRILKLGAFICGLVQMGALSLLLAEMIINPPWNNDSDSEIAHGSSYLVLGTKLLCIIILTVYFMREIISLSALFNIRKRVQEFGTPRVTKLLVFVAYFNLLVWLVAIVLSVGIISTAKSGFDAVLNSVAITFILEIDDWMFSFVRNHPYIQPDLFEIKFKMSKITSSTYSLNYYMKDKCCMSRNFRDPDHPNFNLPEISRRFRGWFPCFCLVLTVAIIFIGFHYESVDDNFMYFGYTGIILAGLMCSCCWCYCCVYCYYYRCGYAPFVRRAWREYQDKVDEMAETYRKRIAELEDEDNYDEKKREIVDEFVEKCFATMRECKAGAKSDVHHKEWLREFFQ